MLKNITSGADSAYLYQNGYNSLKKFFLNICSFLRDGERQSMSGGGAEREGDTESEASSRLQAVSTEPDAGLKPSNREIMT